jgi:general secretion pathway protein A
MYTDHFRLSRNPFTPLAAGRPFPSKELREVLAHFEYARGSGESFFLLVGEVGTGKSFAVRSIVSTLGPEIPVAVLSHTSLGARELVEEVARRFGIEPGASSRPELLDVLVQFLGRSTPDAPAVLIVDEAHLLSDLALEEIRLLSNLKWVGRDLLQICLVGQPELADRLRGPRLRPLRQRIAVRYTFGGLDREETREYIRHRLSSAGALDPRGIFSDDAADAVHELTSGLPREINVVASQAMLNAYLEHAPAVEAIHVRTTREDYGFEGLSLEPAGRVEPGAHERDPRLARANEEALFEAEDEEEPRPRAASEQPGVELPLHVDFLESWELPWTRHRRLSSQIWLSAVAIATVSLTVSLAVMFYLQPEFIEDWIQREYIEDWIPAPPPSSVLLTPGGLSLPAPPPVDRSRFVTATEVEPRVPEEKDSPRPDLPAAPAPEGEASGLRVVSLSSPPSAPAPSPVGEAADLVEYGAHLADRGRTDDAIAAFRRALALAPGHAVALHNLGLSLLENGQPLEAVEPLREAAANSPEDGSTYRTLGIALRQSGELSAAAAALERAVELSPNDSLALRHLANALRESGELQESIEATRKAVALKPEDAKLLHELGFTLRLAGRLSEAARAFQRAIDIEGDFALAHYSLGVTLFELGDHDAAEQQIAEASRLGYKVR